MARSIIFQIIGLFCMLHVGFKDFGISKEFVLRLQFDPTWLFGQRYTRVGLGVELLLFVFMSYLVGLCYGQWLEILTYKNGCGIEEVVI